MVWHLRSGRQLQQVRNLSWVETAVSSRRSQRSSLWTLPAQHQPAHVRRSFNNTKRTHFVFNARSAFGDSFCVEIVRKMEYILFSLAAHTSSTHSQLSDTSGHIMRAYSFVSNRDGQQRKMNGRKHLLLRLQSKWERNFTFCYHKRRRQQNERSFIVENDYNFICYGGDNFSSYFFFFVKLWDPDYVVCWLHQPPAEVAAALVTMTMSLFI